MVKVIILSHLLNLIFGTFQISNKSQNDVEIKVYNQSRLIHHHIMHPNDELEIRQVNDGVLVQYKMIEIYCGGKNSICKPEGQNRDLGNGWQECFVSEWQLTFNAVYYWTFRNRKCKQV